MDAAITDEILEALSSTLQRVEAQSSAILEFVRDKGIVKEDELAPYLERANAASSVRWRATRVRLEKLFSGLEKKQQQQAQQQDEERKEAEQKPVEQKKEQQKEEVRKHEAGESEAGKAAGPKTPAKPQTEEAKRETEETKPESEQELAQASQPRDSHRNYRSAQPKQPAHAEGVSDSVAGREQEPHPASQEKRSKTAPASTEPPTEKSKRSDAA